jgi:MoaA/NifB/PqqE/SkfB family radical SAM enzyme
MKTSVFLRIAAFGLSTVVFRRSAPILATVILTDRCNLACKHCAVSDPSLAESEVNAPPPLAPSGT